MKKTLISSVPADIPRELLPYIKDSRIFDSSSSPEARVYYVERGGYYLKRAVGGSLEKEALMTEYFHSKGLGTEVLEYLTSGGEDFLLTAKMRGEDCTSDIFLTSPERLCDTIAEELRILHGLDYSGCPIMNRTEVYIKTALENYKSGNYDSSHFPDSFGYSSAEEAIAVLREGRDVLRSDTLIHGDYCLPNIILDGWGLAGFIDLGNAGVADRHIDLFWGAWTLGFNLGTDKYRERFFDAYGRDRVDKYALKVVAAAEVFG
ncbi:MAG: aminoglycoside 3'-phosphotransferase [Ruminococcaceae bacterium]|nr:aminoglycoside 3'-phosphotransferase [Oscillospiraceae bacterium]